MNTQELAHAHPDAYAALPECYQADDVLYFWCETAAHLGESFLYARPSDGQEAALGAWTMEYNAETHTWIHSEFGLPLSDWKRA